MTTMKLEIESIKGVTHYIHVFRGATGRGDAGGACPLLNFILWLRTYLLIEEQHILYLAMYYLILLQIYLRPPLKITQLLP